MSNPATPGQIGILAFFGRTAKTSSEAHALINELLADPESARRWLTERARRLLTKLPDLRRDKEDPQDSHGELFKAAVALVHGFELDQATAFPLLREYANRSDQPWSDHEVSYKLRSAANSTHELPRGHLLGDGPTNPRSNPKGNVNDGPSGGSRTTEPSRAAPSPRKLVEFDPKKLTELAAKWRPVVNVEWLANRSISDPCAIGPRDYLASLYRPGEKVLLFTIYKSQGQALWPKDEVPVAGAEGVWYLAQPVNGESLPNPRTGRMSRRSMESVTEFRYLVLESDKADVRDWLGLIVQLPLRIEAIYTSGGKSVHALVRVDCPSHRIWEDYVRGLMPTLNLLGMAGVDPKTLTSVRLTRLPGCLRAGKLQKLLFFLPNRGPTDVRPISELAVQRDVTAPWLAQSNLVVDGHAETTRELRRALRYYAPCNASCRQALADVGEGS